ncbi:heme oxygenase [Stella humosa]|uniref:Heme oxygenase n=1 Tax=Stella humosa TaxID=94 RepID=A0A3N1LIG3_9PROT|nr:biliverdin-producing heme oxygenase [Stella humosa]ROP90628.1 heme oxygenase [Stella humosa]BBK29475.1 heme oxygenase [Stella humosa]
MNAEAPGLALALRQGTADLHRRAEQAGIVRAILAGQVQRHGYALYLRNLLPAYQALERGLDSHRAAPGLAPLALPQLYRAGAIMRDLDVLTGAGWADELPLLPAGAAYAAAVDAAAAGDGAGLAGHAYTRYLGDLSGGRIMARLLAAVPGIGPAAMQFHRFPEIPDIGAFKDAYRAGLDRLGRRLADPGRVVAAARAAFAHNIELAEAVGAAASAAD